jgi:hypothetical protein
MARTRNTMARNFKELEAKMDSERRARVEMRVQESTRAIPTYLDSKIESKPPTFLSLGREQE